MSSSCRVSPFFEKNAFVSISCRRYLINPNTQQEVANRSPTLSEIPKQDAIISQHKPCLVIDKPAPHKLQKSVHKFARKHEHHNPSLNQKPNKQLETSQNNPMRIFFFG